MAESDEADKVPLTRPLTEALADALGVEPGDVLGASLDIAFRIRTENPARIFLSGLTDDFAATAVGGLGGRLLVDPVPEGRPARPGDNGSRAPVGATTITVADTLWSTATGGTTVGFGPVVLEAGAEGWRRRCRRLTISAGPAPDRSRRQRVQHLRETFARVADRLQSEVTPLVDWSILAGPGPAVAAWMAAGLEHVAATRAAVGSYLIAIADEVDDERIDQLGDGYHRAGQLWQELAGGRPGAGPEVHDLERSCVAWMGKAAGPPARYAF